MSAIAAKKPPVPGRDASSTSPSSVSRAAPRSSTPNGGIPAERPGSAASRSRARSFRTGAPVSARQAAGERRKSQLPPPGAHGLSAGAASVEEAESARAENIAALDDLKERLSRADMSSEEYRKQAEVLQARLDDVVKDQVKYEERCHELEEQTEALQNEKREATRKIREMEAIYEAERSAIVKDKEDMANKEEELQMVIARLKDSLNQQKMAPEDDARSSRSGPLASPPLEGGSFAPPASLQRSDSRNQSKLILQKDKLIESLRLELAEAQIKLVETENQGGGRLQEVERLLMETRMANARLMEDNESYQLLLQEKTLSGDLGRDDFSYMRGSQSNEDALAALEGKAGHASLADELNDASEGEEPEPTDLTRRLEAELRSMNDQNKALTLYINRIIERLLEHDNYEHILDQTEPSSKPNTDKDLPPPPQASGASILGRVKSMAINTTVGAVQGKRPRPMSVMPVPNSAHTNPDTAPRIPIGQVKSQSKRRSRPLSEQYTGAAASVVNQMYKGTDGPLSPALRSPRDLFNSQQRERQASGATAASVPGNFPGSMRSETSSVSGDSSTCDKETVSSSSNQSPPRDKKVTQSFAAGNKPRTLRLVQEKDEAQAAANKRQSWIGGWFAGVGAKKEEIVSPRESMIRE